MPLVEVNWRPERKQLTLFRWGALAASVLVFALGKGISLPWSVLVLGLGLAIWGSGFLSLRLTRVFYVALTAATLPIGIGVSLLLLTICYFGLITPIALIFRVSGRDVLHRRFEPGALTYWQPHPPVERESRYFEQY
jgi:hypothetical protein